MSREEYEWIANAIGYYNVASVGAAYTKLVHYRETVERYGELVIKKENPVTVKGVSQYDEWVRSEFSVFTDDPLHPIFNRA